MQNEKRAGELKNTRNTLLVNNMQIHSVRTSCDLTDALCKNVSPYYLYRCGKLATHKCTVWETALNTDHNTIKDEHVCALKGQNKTG